MAEVTRSEALSQVRRTISAYRDSVHEVRADTDYLPPEGARIVDEYCSFGNDWQDLVQDAIREPPFLDMMDDGLLLEYCAVCKELDEALGLGSWSIGSVDRIVKDEKGFWETLWGALQGKFNEDLSINEKTKRHNQNLSSMGGVFNMTNANLCHCVGNTLVKYTASDRREVSYYPQHFDVENYVKHQLNAMGAGFYIAFRQVKSYIGNFFANLFTGKGWNCCIWLCTNRRYFIWMYNYRNGKKRFFN